MKKILSLILAVSCLVGVMLFPSFSAETKTVTFYYEDIDVTVEIENHNNDYDDLKAIADAIAYGKDLNDGISVCGLTCTLFGHDIYTTKATRWDHKKFATAPRCLRETFDIEDCQRDGCDYLVRTLTESTRVNCCS